MAFRGFEPLADQEVKNEAGNPITTRIDSVRGVISTVNSTMTPLAAGAEFVGTAEEITDYAQIHVFVFASHDSAADGFVAEHSTDGTNWDDNDKASILAGKGKPYTFPPEAKFFRVRFKNGVTAQTAFRLQTTYKYTRSKPSTHIIKVDISDNDDTELVRAIISGRKPDGQYTNASFDSQGRLIVAPAGASTAVKGFVDGKLEMTVSNVVPIRATTYTEQTTNAQRSLVSSSASDAAAGEGARTVKITYFDQTLAGPFTETVTLNGTTAVNTIATNISFIEKMIVLTAGTNATIPVGTISLHSGINGTGSTVWSIAVGDGRTFSVHHYVVSGTTLLITGFTAGTKGADSTGVSYFLRSMNPIGNEIEQQLSDTLRSRVDGNTVTRLYTTPIEVPGPRRVTAFVSPDTSGNRTYFASFDFYEE